MTNVMWFRRDLRLADNPAWSAATRSGGALVTAFVLEPGLFRAAGELREAWVLATLHELDARLRELGGRLHVTEGPALPALRRLAGLDGTVFWNADYTPFAVARDRVVEAELGDRAVVTHGGVIHAPGVVRKSDGDPYRVFTPFWRAWRDVPWETWEPAMPSVDLVADPGLEIPRPRTVLPMAAGEVAAVQRLHEFLGRLGRYQEHGDRPAANATSRLSADLKVGSIDARRVRAEVGEDTEAGVALVRQLAWRDFYAGLLATDPESPDRSRGPRYRRIEWRRDPDGFTAWRAGQTGYPFVDAGMRQLVATGQMPNRVRMVAASFLVKDLQIDWREGERHFRRHLLDADVASNVGNWQWVAGTGPDAAPYFRVMNPVAQGERHDADGDYVRKWVPELSDVPARWIHRPWEAAPLDLAGWGVTLGVDYPFPLVDHAEARQEVVERYRRALR